MRKDWKWGKRAVGSKAVLKNRIAYAKGCVGGRPEKSMLEPQASTKEGRQVEASVCAYGASLRKQL